MLQQRLSIICELTPLIFCECNTAIAELNIPTGTPLVYELDEDLKPIPQAGAIAPLQGRYLGDQEAIKARIEGVKNQTKVSSCYLSMQKR